MSNLKWHFPSTGNGEEDGLNDPLRENFEGDHERFVARETIQNSIDATAERDEPVRVHFERFMLPTDQIPGRSELIEILTLARTYSEGQEGSGQFYDDALRSIQAKEIPVLKVSDINTTGLNGGDQDKEGEWYRLIRSTGASSMSGAGGGSFGIGKGAPFAASSLRTVFYSTIDSKGNPAFQGKARISSFEFHNDVKRGIGLFGESQDRGVASVRQEAAIPLPFRREKTGTDIYIIGYLTEETDWRHRLMQSVAENFWATIHFGDLVVSFSESGTPTEEISKANLEEYLLKTPSNGKTPTLHFYKALVEGKEINSGVRLLGNCSLFVKKADGYPKRVQMMRKSKMVIKTTSPSAFRVLGEPFAAVFVCFSDEGNKRLRLLEPPAHNEWDPARDKKLGKEIIRELNEFIKGSLRSLAEDTDNQPEEIPELNFYLPEEDDLNSGSGAEGILAVGTAPPESASETGAVHPETIAPQTRRPEKKLAIIKKVGLGGDKSTERTGTGTASGKKGSVDPSTDGKFPHINLSNIKFRARQIHRQVKILYQTVITPLADDFGSLKITAVGEDARYPIEMLSVESADGTHVDFDGSLIKDLKLVKDEPVRLFITLSSKKKYAIGVGTDDSI